MPNVVLPESPLRVGDKYRFGGKKLIHIRGLVDDQVICRHWSIEMGWIYECEDAEFFKTGYGFYTKVK